MQGGNVLASMLSKQIDDAFCRRHQRADRKKAGGTLVFYHVEILKKEKGNSKESRPFCHIRKPPTPPTM